MVEYLNNGSQRIARSRWNRTCKRCGGAILKGTEYLCTDDREGGARWKHAEHLDCERWFETTIKNGLYNLSLIPHRVPPVEQQDPRLVTAPVIIRVESETLGLLIWQLPVEIAIRFHHARSVETRDAAIVEITEATACFLRAILKATSHKKISLQFAHRVIDLERLLDAA